MKGAFRAGFFGCLGVGVAIIAVIVIVAVVSNTGKSGATLGGGLTKKVVLDASGNGTKQTQKFDVSGDYDIAYTYDCSGFAGGQGNFIVSVYEGDNLPTHYAAINTLGKSGGDTTHLHDGGKGTYLDITSECAWTVKVTD